MNAPIPAPEPPGGATALIGHTGFVGGNLLRQRSFNDLYNSRNIESIRGKSYGFVVCAGLPAAKWRANADPAADLASLSRLVTALDGATIDELIVISTVDVYDPPVGVDEDTVIAHDSGHPYGRHRLRLEEFARERFRTRVIRLPGLFGSGLKKNVIYDILHANNLDDVCAGSEYQFYSLERLTADIERVRELDLGLVNFATERVSVGRLAEEVFEVDSNLFGASREACYDVRTRYGLEFGGVDGYMQTAESVLGDMRDFARSVGWPH